MTSVIRDTTKAIWKFQLRIDDEQLVDVPMGSSPLSVAFQGDRLNLWMLAPKSNPILPRRVYIVGTGHPVPAGVDQMDFIGTVQQYGGQLIWHVFMERQ